MKDRLQALHDADKECSEHVTELFGRYGSNRISVTAEEWDASTDVFAARDAARAALMPTEQDAINLMHEAYTRLKDLGWREAIYCPKDGSTFDAVEPGSTGIHETHYSGTWPDGHWYCFDGGDVWPSRPVLYCPTEAEKAENEARKERFRALASTPQDPTHKGEP
ncbi:hypothetical protein KFK14_12855 [Sphingobium phenoxybenzoativorans]|uniref:Uncharacterized protein n=1 Tax=Sphingobium phenoxybenzoativorans TaxID=1592790 RepID=A0A975K334_9SPHN|nr:hypothetical protein [Sphingobium phenoxybenzoativorans]QUT04036.1 hypothetical protein KFK14_12855 [Sphingobium phenoxybenzoativorans]